MNEPRLKLGADDRLLAVVFALLICAGCVAQTDSGKTTKPKPKPIGKQTLADLAYESFQQRDGVRAKKLREAADEIDAGKLKYDGPCMDRMAEIGAQSSEQTWKPTAEKAQEIMSGEKWDAVKAAKVFRDIADGSERAGK